MIISKDKVEYVEIELSTMCQAKCPLCYRNYKAFKSHYPKNIERPLNDIINQLDEYVNLKWVYLVGSISEPTLYSHFFDVVKYIKDRGVMIELCTNGSTRNEAWWNDLGRLLTTDDKVYFTICGSTQELHETYRRGTSLERILRNARALRESCACDYAQCIRFAYNDADMHSRAFKDIIDEFTHIYWTETFLLKDMDNYTVPFDSELFMPHAANREKFEKLKELADKINARPHKCFCESIHYKKIQIDIYGNVYPCYLFLEASGGKHWDGNYSKIINGKYDCCKFCHSAIKRYCDKNGLDTII